MKTTAEKSTPLLNVLSVIFSPFLSFSMSANNTSKIILLIEIYGMSFDIDLDILYFDFESKQFN